MSIKRNLNWLQTRYVSLFDAELSIANKGLFELATSSVADQSLYWTSSNKQETILLC